MTAQIHDLAARQALQWLATLADQPSDASLREFEHWLAQAPEHVMAWEAARYAWAASERPARQLAAEEAAALERLLASMDTPPAPRWRRWGKGLAAAAAVVVVASLAGWGPVRLWQNVQADHRCPAGPVCHVTLADGSQLTLDAGSALAVDFDQGSRRVTLLRGAAFFQVTHTGVPFRVSTGGGEVQVMGTEFEVRRETSDERVTVLSGRVAVRAATGAPAQLLQAGQQVVYAGGLASAAAKVDAPRSLAWRDGWLNYTQAPLAQVVQDLSTYYPGRIVVLNRALAARTLSGSFPSGDPAAVLDTLQKALGFEQTRLPGLIVLR